MKSKSNNTETAIATRPRSGSQDDNEEAGWDDAKLRHAYLPKAHRIALCGYSGPSTWRNERAVPVNVCPICLALLPEYWDGRKCIKKPEVQP